MNNKYTVTEEDKNAAKEIINDVFSVRGYDESFYNEVARVISKNMYGERTITERLAKNLQDFVRLSEKIICEGINPEAHIALDRLKEKAKDALYDAGMLDAYWCEGCGQRATGYSEDDTPICEECSNVK